MSLQIKENSTKISLKVDNQYKKISSFVASDNELFENMSTNKKFSINIVIEKKLEATMNMRLNEFKPETVSSIHINRSSLSSNIFSSSYDQPSADLIKLTLLKSSEKYYHA